MTSPVSAHIGLSASRHRGTVKPWRCLVLRMRRLAPVPGRIAQHRLSNRVLFPVAKGVRPPLLLAGPGSRRSLRTMLAAQGRCAS